jgi:3-oxoacyl-[acyl-carrier-protein] synthase II
MRRVVVTGVGVVSPIGIGAKAFFDALLAGTSGIRRVSLFDPTSFPSQIAGEVGEYKIGDFVPKSYRKATKVMARDIELAVVAADDAFKDSQLLSRAYTETPAFDGKRFGCNIGAGLISADLQELTSAMITARNGNALDLKKWGSEGINQLTPLWLLKYLPNMLACHVTIIHGLRGPSNTVTCADASSHLAIGEAFRTVQRGAADFAICGGAETKIHPMGMLRQSLIHRVATDANDRPATACRPFDQAASGSVLGEGGGLLILESYDSAKARGAKIYAEIVGFGASQDAYSVTEPDPSGRSYAAAIRNSLRDAKLNVSDVDLIVPNGLGIPAFDRAELAGLKTAFGNDLEKVYFSPIKSQIGNLSAGTGVDAVAAVMSLASGKVPPATNTVHPIDGVKLNVSQSARDAKLQTAVSSVYSLGGQNASLVFKAV